MKAFEPGSDTATEWYEDALYVARLPGGPIVVLEGTAALTWTEACRDLPDTVAARVALRLNQDVADIAADIDVFIAGLVEQGLLRAVR